MNDTIDRTLKELFAAIYHDHEKHPGMEIRPDQETVLNKLLNQPPDFKNKVLVKDDGLEIYTQKEKLQYIHSKSVDSRVIMR
jgi:hypothetical protein